MSEIGMTPTNTAATKAGDLLPCPFCGSKTLYVKHEPKTILHPAYYVHCDDCGAQSGAWERGEHIEEWNRRAAAPAEPALAAESADIVHDDAGKAWALAPINGTTWDMRNEGRELLIDHDCKADRLDELADTIYRAMIGVRPPFKPDPAQSADVPRDDPVAWQAYAHGRWTQICEDQASQCRELGVDVRALYSRPRPDADTPSDRAAHAVVGGLPSWSPFRSVSRPQPDTPSEAEHFATRVHHDSGLWWVLVCVGGDEFRIGSGFVEQQRAERLADRIANAALASRPQPARGEVSEATKVIALALAHIANGIPNAKEVAADALSQAAALEAAARVRADHFVDANKIEGDAK